MHSLVLITGASRGFGRSLALALAPALVSSGPVTFVLWARDAVGLAETAALVVAKVPSTRCVTRVVDLAETGSLSGHWRSLEDMCPAGSITRAFLIQNAGSLGHLQPVADTADFDFLSREVAVNITAPYIMASLFLRWVHSRAGPTTQTGGNVILNISSLAAVQPFRCWASYCTGLGGHGVPAAWRSLGFTSRSSQARLPAICFIAASPRRRRSRRGSRERPWPCKPSTTRRGPWIRRCRYVEGHAHAA